MINRVVLVGRWTRDPELTFTPNTGTAVATCTLAVNRQFKQDEADFPQVVMWKKAAENTAQYTKKGTLVAVEGRIQTRSYDTPEGQRRFVTEVVADNVRFLDTKKKDNTDNEYYSFGEEVDESPPF